MVGNCEYIFENNKRVNKYKNQEFGLKEIKKDLYEIFTKSGEYEGQINLGSEHIFELK